MRVLKLLIATALLGAVAGIAHAALAGSFDRAGARGGSAGALSLSGSVDGLYPGAAIAFPVRVANPRHRPVSVRSVRVRVGAAASGCGPEFLTIPPSRGRLRIRPRSTRSVRLRATLAPQAPDACQGASFPLRFSARAVVKP